MMFGIRQKRVVSARDRLRREIINNAWELLGDLSRAKSISFLWVPWHAGVVGNKKADWLATRGTSDIRP